MLSTAIVAMVKKFQKYYEIPLLYALCCTLNPRTKLNSLKSFTEYIGGYLDLDLTQHFTNLHSKVLEVYRLYEHRFSDKNMQRLEQPDTRPKKSMRILTGNQESSSLSSQHCELNTFFETKFDIAHQGDFQEFDLLLWWRNHTKSYPVLS